MSPIKRMTSAFSSAGDRSSRVPGGDMPLQNLKSLYAESPDLPIFTRAVSPCPPRLPPAKPPLPGLLPLLPLSVTQSVPDSGLSRSDRFIHGCQGTLLIPPHPGFDWLGGLPEFEQDRGRKVETGRHAAVDHRFKTELAKALGFGLVGHHRKPFYRGVSPQCDRRQFALRFVRRLGEGADPSTVHRHRFPQARIRHVAEGGDITIGDGLRQPALIAFDRAVTDAELIERVGKGAPDRAHPDD